MAIYSVLLAAGRVTEETSLDVYTAPDVGVVVVRDIVLGNFSGGAALMSVQAGSGSSYVPLLQVPEVENASTFHWEGRQVLLPGQKLGFSTLAGPATYRISGYHLGAP